MFYKNNLYKFQYLIVIFLPLIFWYLCGEIFLYRTPFILPVFFILPFLAFLLIKKNILGLYIIIGAMCLSGGIISIGSGGQVIEFFSDLSLPLNLNLFELLSLGTMAILYASICLKRDLRLFEETRLSHSMYIFSLAIVINWLFSSIRTYNFEGLYELRRFISMPLVFVLMINLIKNEEQLKFIIKLFIVCIGIKSITGLITIFISRSFVLLYPGWSETTVFLTVIFFYLGFRDNCPGDPLVKTMRIFLIPMCLCILFSTRRTLWGSFIITICLYFLFMKKTGKIKFIGLLIPAGVIFVTLVSLSDSSPTASNGEFSLSSEIESMKNPFEAHTFILRQWEWKNAWEYIKLNPLFGNGLGTVLEPIVDFKYVKRNAFASMVFHNNYLWIWAKMGLVVFVPFLLLIYLSIKNTYQLYVELEDPYYRSVLLGIFLSLMNFIIAGFISPSMAEIKINVWLGFTFGLIVLIRRFKRSEIISQINI